MVGQRHIYTTHHSRSSDYGHNGVLDQSATAMTITSSEDEVLHTRNQWLLKLQAYRFNPMLES